MIRMKGSVCIESSASVVWSALADLEKVPLWVEPIREAHCEGDTRRGTGAIRVCKLKGNMTIKEKWVAWDEGKSFTYVAYGMPLIKSAKNTWTVKPENGKTLLTTDAEIEFKWGIFGKLLELALGSGMRRMGPPTLAAFKYWVENGRPYEGKHSSLPVAPAAC